MRILFSKTILVAILALCITYASLGSAVGSDLAASANIYLFPKSFALGDFQLKDLSGSAVSLTDFRGKVVLLHFWSIDCPACRHEEPRLENLKRTYGGSGLEIVAVNLVDQPQAIAAHASAKGMPFPVLFDGGSGFRLRPVSMSGHQTAFVINPLNEAILEVPGFPTTYIVDCKGNVVGYSVGAARWDQPSAQAFLHNLISQVKTCGGTSSSSPGNQISLRPATRPSR